MPVPETLPRSLAARFQRPLPAFIPTPCRWEAHIWVKDMGRQVYLGGYEDEAHAAEAYDVAALKSKGVKV